MLYQVGNTMLYCTSLSKCDFVKINPAPGGAFGREAAFEVALAEVMVGPIITWSSNFAGARAVRLEAGLGAILKLVRRRERMLH